MDGLPPQYILISNRVMISLTGEVREYYRSSNKIKIYHQLWRAGVFNLKTSKTTSNGAICIPTNRLSVFYLLASRRVKLSPTSLALLQAERPKKKTGLLVSNFLHKLIIIY